MQLVAWPWAVVQTAKAAREAERMVAQKKREAEREARRWFAIMTDDNDPEWFEENVVA